MKQLREMASEVAKVRVPPVVTVGTNSLRGIWTALMAGIGATAVVGLIVLLVSR